MENTLGKDEREPTRGIGRSHVFYLLQQVSDLLTQLHELASCLPYVSLVFGHLNVLLSTQFSKISFSTYF